VIVDFEINPDILRKISSLIQSGKYSDINQFIQRALDNLIVREEYSDKEKAIGFNEISGTIKNDQIGDKFSKEISLLFDNVDFKLLAGEIQKHVKEYRDTVDPTFEYLKKFEIPITIKNFGAEPKIRKFVTRFFPIKLIISVISFYMMKNNLSWFRLDEVDNLVYLIAIYFAELLKSYEEAHGLPRQSKLSTGLPLPLSAKKGKRGRAVSKMENKISSSKERFLDYYLARSGKKYEEKKEGDEKVEWDFKPGACMRMGLLGYQINDMTGEIMLTLTKEGKEFAKLRNPIINESDLSRAFNEDESKFIMEKIIPRFHLEKIIIDKIVSKFEEKNELKPEELDNLFEDEKTNYLQNNPDVDAKKSDITLLADVKSIDICPKCKSDDVIFSEEKKQLECQKCPHIIKNPNAADRAVTMGRLSELGVIKWIVGERGKASYQLRQT